MKIRWSCEMSLNCVWVEHLFTSKNVIDKTFILQILITEQLYCTGFCIFHYMYKLCRS